MKPVPGGSDYFIRRCKKQHGYRTAPFSAGYIKSITIQEGCRAEPEMIMYFDSLGNFH